MPAKHAHVIDYIAVDVRPNDAANVFGTVSVAAGILCQIVAYTIILDGTVKENVVFDMPKIYTGGVFPLTATDEQKNQLKVWAPIVRDVPTRVIFLYTYSKDQGKTWTPISPLDEGIFVQNPPATGLKPADVVVNITPGKEQMSAADFRNVTMSTVSLPLAA